MTFKFQLSIFTIDNYGQTMDAVERLSKIYNLSNFSIERGYGSQYKVNVRGKRSDCDNFYDKLKEFIK